MTSPTKHIVQYSTGAGSAEVAVRVVQEHGVENTVLMSADTLVEDPDNWRFAEEAWRWMGEPEWIRLVEGRNPMQVGRDRKIVPNDRMAICSRILKRETIRKHLDKNYDPACTVIYLGFDWTEEHRYEKSIEPWKPWTIDCPLLRPPYLQKADILGAWRERGIEPPSLYQYGFSHANCGGGCVRGGQAQWELLLRTFPERYAWWEAEEEQTRAELAKDVSILAEVRQGVKYPLTLRNFRLRLESQPSLFAADDWGACGCFTGTEESGTEVLAPEQVVELVVKRD